MSRENFLFRNIKVFEIIKFEVSRVHCKYKGKVGHFPCAYPVRPFNFIPVKKRFLYLET